MNILILGSGGREHALAWRLSQDASCTKVYVWPGNAGMKEEKILCVQGPYSNEAFKRFLGEYHISLVIPGAEQFLYEGIADLCDKEKVACFGPSREAARLEKSKLFSKVLMEEAGIPTARYEDITQDFQRDLNLSYSKARTFSRPVIKISGPSLGKGVFVCDHPEDACEVLFKLKEAPLAGQEDGILIEEGVSGKEVSLFFACAGTKYTFLGSAQDYKRVFDGDKGPNTGGMGAVSPVPWVDEKFLAAVQERVVLPTLLTMEKRGTPFRGVLFLGLMVNGDDFKLLEYNVRFGDPETQALMPLLVGDLSLFLKAMALQKETPSLKLRPQTSLHVVKAAAGYPGTFGTSIEKGKLIHLPVSDWGDGKLFFAGVKDHKSDLLTNGGRVLGVTAWSSTFAEARIHCYELLEKVSFSGEHFRRDIGRNL